MRTPMLIPILVPWLAGCTAHRTAMPAGYAMLPSFPEPGELILVGGATPLVNTQRGYDLRVGGRLTEELALGFIASGPLEEPFDDLVPGLQLGLEASLLQAPLDVDVSFGASQSGLFTGTRIGVAHAHRWARDRWGARAAAAVFGAVPFGASCGGEFVACPHGPTRAAFGAETSLAIGTRFEGAELVVGPRFAVINAGGSDIEMVYGLVLQLEATIRIDDARSPMRADAATRHDL